MSHTISFPYWLQTLYPYIIAMPEGVSMLLIPTLLVFLDINDRNLISIWAKPKEKLFLLLWLLLFSSFTKKVHSQS